MNPINNERAKMLEEYLEAKEKLRRLEEENQFLKETNYMLSQRLEEKDAAVQNLFSYIEGIKSSDEEA